MIKKKKVAVMIERRCGMKKNKREKVAVMIDKTIVNKGNTNFPAKVEIIARIPTNGYARVQAPNCGYFTNTEEQGIVLFKTNASFPSPKEADKWIKETLDHLRKELKEAHKRYLELDKWADNVIVYL